MATLAELTVKLNGDVNALNNAMKSASDNVRNSVGNITQSLNKISMAAGVAALAFAGIAKNLIDTASNFEVMKTRLAMVHGGMQGANAEFERLIDLAKQSTKFDLEAFTTASIHMENFQKGASKILPAVAGMAEVLGVDLTTASDSVARAMMGDTRAFLTLERQLGITKPKLKEFDAAFDETGKAVESNAKILEAFIQAKYGDSLAKFGDTAKSKMGELKLQIDVLKASIGEHMLPVVSDMVGKLIKLAEAFENMTPEQKKSTAEFLLLAPAVLGVVSVTALMASQVLQGAVALKAMLPLLKGTAVSALAAAKGLGALALAHAPLAVAIAGTIALAKVLNDTLKEQIKEQEILQSMIQKSSAAEMAYYKFKRTGQLEEKEIAIAIAGAREKGDKEAIAGIRALIKGSDEYLEKNAEVIMSEKVKAKAAEDEKARIVNIQRMIELDKATIADKKELIFLLRSQAAETEDAEAKHKLLVQAHQMEKTIIDKTKEAKKEDKAISTDSLNTQIDLQEDLNEKQQEQIPALEAKKTAEEKITDDIARLTMDKGDYEILQIQKQVEEWKKAGVEREKIEQWISAKTKELSASATDAQIEDVKRLQDAKTEEKLSPIMDMGEMARRQAQLFQATPLETAAKEEPVTAALPSKKKSISAQELLAGYQEKAPTLAGQQAQAGAMAAAGAQEVVNNQYTINVAGIEITGEKAEKFKNVLVDILEDSNAAETLPEDKG